MCVYAARVHIFVQITPVATHARFQLYSKSFVKHKNCCSLTEWSALLSGADTPYSLCANIETLKCDCPLSIRVCTV
jgi:hypothetical protein